MRSLFGCLGLGSKKITPNKQNRDSLTPNNPGRTSNAPLDSPVPTPHPPSRATQAHMDFIYFQALRIVTEGGKLSDVPIYQNDKNFVLDVVMQNGMELQYASPELRADKEVVMAAVKQHAFSIAYAADDIKSDQPFLLECVCEVGTNWSILLSNANVNNHIGTFERGELLINNREFLIKLIEIQPDAYLLAHPTLKADPQIMLAAIKNALFLKGILTWETLKPKSDPLNILSTCRDTLNGFLLSSETFEFDFEPNIHPEEKLRVIATQLNEYTQYKESPVWPEQIKIVNLEQGVTIFIRQKAEVLKDLLNKIPGQSELKNKIDPYLPETIRGG